MDKKKIHIYVKMTNLIQQVKFKNKGGSKNAVIQRDTQDMMWKPALQLF